MSRRSGIASKSIDWIALTVFFSLLIIGWLMLYAAVYDSENPYAYLDFKSAIGKQTLWLGVAIVTFVIVYVIEWEFWNSFAFPIYAIGIVLLVLVLIIGTEIKGARSWFSLFGFSFQPSELVKFTTALAVSSFLSSYKVDLRNRNTLLIALGLILLPMALIILQPDPGSAIIFLSFFVLFYRRGLSPLVYILGFSIIGIFICSIVFDPKSVTLLIALIGLGIFMYNIGQSWRSGLIFFAISSVGLLLFIRDLYWYGLGIILCGVVVYSIMMIKERLFRTLTIVLPSLLGKA